MRKSSKEEMSVSHLGLQEERQIGVALHHNANVPIISDFNHLNANLISHPDSLKFKIPVTVEMYHHAVPAPSVPDIFGAPLLINYYDYFLI